MESSFRDLAKQLSKLSPEQRERLLAKVQPQAPSKAKLESPQDAENQIDSVLQTSDQQPKLTSETLPLAPVQRRLWLLDRLDGKNPAD